MSALVGMLAASDALYLTGVTRLRARDVTARNDVHVRCAPWLRAKWLGVVST